MSGHELHFQVLPWIERDNVKLSSFDLRLRRCWNQTVEKGVFLHGVESEPSRIPGKRKFVAVLCRNRASQKRKPQSFTNIKQDINPVSFNFTKVKSAEKLFIIKVARPIEDFSSFDFEFPIKNSDSKEIENNSLSDNSLSVLSTSVIINNSPYEFGHSLLVPELDKLHIQSITASAIRMGIEVLLKSSHPGFRLMYNSLCGGASINHLHLHCYYTEYWLNSEAFGMKPLFSETNIARCTENSLLPLRDCFELDFRDSCVRGFGFIITEQNYANHLPSIVYKIVEYFNTKNIPHNIVIIRGLPLNTDSTGLTLNEKKLYLEQDQFKIENSVTQNLNIPVIKDDHPPYSDLNNINPVLASLPLVGRLYIYPRVPLYGEKCYRKFLVNVTELFGHLYFGDVDIFNSMNENDVVKALNAVSISKDEFARIKADIIKILLS